MDPTGSRQTRLVVVRGNSGCGKTSAALAVLSQLGRTCALVQQDVMRRSVLKERDVPNGVNIGLISTVALYRARSRQERVDLRLGPTTAFGHDGRSCAFGCCI